jgi:hypothetical protein
LSPVTHDLGEGGDGDGGDDDERETSPVAEAQIETWLASAAAEEAVNLGGSSAEANSSPKPTSLAVLREAGEGDDESEGGMVDLLETPASLLPFPGSSPPPTLTPMRQPVADWPGTAAAGGDGWPNNTRAYSQQPAKLTAYYCQLVTRVSRVRWPIILSVAAAPHRVRSCEVSADSGCGSISSRSRSRRRRRRLG